MKYFLAVISGTIIMIFLQACSASHKMKTSPNNAVIKDHVPQVKNSAKEIPAVFINTNNSNADEVVNFSKTLIGIKYKYGSAVKEQGFDCSGFITYVFNHFKINVPRVSKNFTNAGTDVSLYNSKPGDLILFTGTDTTGWIVGHMGMISENDNGAVKFIHSSSGKSVGVIISSLSTYYAARLVKVIRVFKN